MNNSVRVTLFLLANVNRLVKATLRTVEVDPPVYKMAFDAAYACCILAFLAPIILAMCIDGRNIRFCKFYSDFCSLFGVKFW